MGSGLSRCCSTNGTGDANTEFVVEQRAFAFHKWQLDVERDEQLQVNRASPEKVYRKVDRKPEPLDKKDDSASLQPPMATQNEIKGEKGKKKQAKKGKEATKKGEKTEKKEDNRENKQI